MVLPYYSKLNLYDRLSTTHPGTDLMGRNVPYKLGRLVCCVNGSRLH